MGAHLALGMSENWRHAEGGARRRCDSSITEASHIPSSSAFFPKKARHGAKSWRVEPAFRKNHDPTKYNQKQV
jgi:hypothetical protein